MTTPFVTAGYNAILYVGGVPTTLTTEATDVVTANTVFRIHNSAKQVLDPTYAVTTNGTGTFHVNRLTGTLTFNDAQTPPISVTGKYIPMGRLLYAKDFSVSIKPTVVDSTPFYTKYTSKKRVIGQVSGTLGTFLAPEEVQSFSAGAAKTMYFPFALRDASTFFLKFYMSANYELRMWAIVDTEAVKEAVEGLNEESVTFSGARDADGNVIAQVITA